MAPTSKFNHGGRSVVPVDHGPAYISTTNKITKSTPVNKAVPVRNSFLLRRNNKKQPLLLKAAKGSWWLASDERGTWKIFDASGGAAVSNIGHGDPRVAAAVGREEIDYAPALTYETDAARDFAEWLIKSTNYSMGSVVLYGSGTNNN